MTTRRQERVNARIVKEVSDAIRDIGDDRMGFITVTRAEVSPDLRHAKVFVSVLGSEDKQKVAIYAVKRYSGEIRSVVGRKLGLKFSPQLHFELDTTVASADHVSQLIAAARATDIRPDEEPGPDESEGEETEG